MCDNSSLYGVLIFTKRAVSIIQIIVPVLLIIMASIELAKMIKNPDEKKSNKKVINQFIAAAIVFFIPLLVNVIMNLVGDNTNFSSCWNSANDKITMNSKYTKLDEKKKKKITNNVENYEKGIPKEASKGNSREVVGGNLNFSCTSQTVKSQFSCKNLKIVEKHLYDFDATNFNSVINNKYGGDFSKYAKSVGGIYGEYYGKKISGTTVASFQTAAEYVLGWMYMYGWDYKIGDGDGRRDSWGQGIYNGSYAPDAFYVNGGYKRGYIPDYDGAEHWWYGTDIDHVISGKNGGTGDMASACGDLALFIYNKLGLERRDENRLEKNIRKLSDLRVGDSIAFFNKNNAITDDFANHLAVVGEVYNDQVVIYDGGGLFIRSQNYKRAIRIPKDDSVEASLKELQKVYGNGYNSWIGYRFYNFS